jgi:hypothetical protein
MQTRKRYTPFAVATGRNVSEPFVRTSFVVDDPMAATTDALAEVRIGAEKHTYLRLATAVAWVEKQLSAPTSEAMGKRLGILGQIVERDKRGTLERKLTVLREPMRNFAAGTMIENTGG